MKVREKYKFYFYTLVVYTICCPCDMRRCAYYGYIQYIQYVQYVYLQSVLFFYFDENDDVAWWIMETRWELGQEPCNFFLILFLFYNDVSTVYVHIQA